MKIQLGYVLNKNPWAEEKYDFLLEVFDLLNKLCVHWKFINVDVYKNNRFNPDLLKISVLDMEEVNKAFINIETMWNTTLNSPLGIMYDRC